MKKTEQQQINDKIGECLEDLSESMEMSAKNRDLMMRLVEFGDTRIDSLENKIDILMTERAEREEFELAKKEAEKEDDVWYNQESKKASLENLNATNKAFEASIEDHLDKERSDTQITPQALVDLGFKENYQGINCGDAGFLYYDLEVKGVAFLSTSLGEDEPLHVMLGYEGRPPIHNLAKLKELIRILILID
jgi:hypothetical protein